MAAAPILDRFSRLNVWSRGDQRAPHKPLLVLYALGRWARGETADIPFQQVDADLTGLLKEFGPPRQSYHPEYPFWRLQNDGVWVVRASGPLTPRQGSTDAKKSDLLAQGATGAFSPEVQAALRADPALIAEIAARLLESHFPQSLHADILDAVGLALGPVSSGERKRDRQFRQRVLVAYEYRCAVCGFEVRLGPVSTARLPAWVFQPACHGTAAGLGPGGHTAPFPPPEGGTATGCPTGQPDGWGTGTGRRTRRRSHTRRYQSRCGQLEDSRTTIRRVRTTTSAATLMSSVRQVQG
jgi:hypothetical protein